MPKAPLFYASLLIFVTGSHPARADLLSVSLSGTAWQRDDGAGYRALVQLEVGWEQLLFGRHTAPQLAEADDPKPPPHSEPPQAEALPVHDENPQRPTSLEEPAPAPVEPLPPWFGSGFARALLRVVVRVSSRSRGSLDSLSARSRTSTLLPVLRLRAGRGADETLRYSPTLDDPDRWLQSGGADLRYEAQATWTLDRLIFADDEIAIERLRQQAARNVLDRGGRALKVFFEWQSAALRLDRLDLDEEARIKLQIIKIQSEIELDVLSGGWFSQELARLQAAAPAN